MTNLLVSLLAATVMLPTGQAETERAKLFTGLGDLHREVTTDAPAAQIYFNQGLAFLYAFNHDWPAPKASRLRGLNSASSCSSP